VSILKSFDIVYNKTNMKLVNGKQMAMVDKRMIEECKISSLQLMEQAGTKLYHKIKQMVLEEDHILVVCGTGNNGGDGYVVARLLHNDGYQVQILAIHTTHQSEDCKVNYQKCLDLNIPFVDEITTPDIIIDAIFGTGLSRNVEARYKTIIKEINNSKAQVISIDIPSGIDSSLGHVYGVCVKANITLTLQTGKIGLYLYPGRLYSGKVYVLDIGIAKQLIEDVDSQIYLIEKKQMGALLPKRSIHSNKGDYGKLFCIGGSKQMSGAISLATLAALRSGCGLITCAIPKNIHEIVATNVLESTFLPLPQKDGHIASTAASIIANAVTNYNCALIGCGITRSKDIIDILKVVLDSDIPLLIDADGLVALKALLPNYKNRKQLILTPHMKEFSRLIDVDVKDIVKDPIYYGTRFIERYPNITLVLKSETSFVFSKSSVYINTYGNNGLAKGGSGDVLAGIIASLYAQNRNSLNASVLGVFLHAYSADLLLEKQTVYSILPSDLFHKIDQIIKELEGGMK